MKIPDRIFLLLLVVFLLDQIEARNKNKRRNKFKANLQNDKCKYKKKGIDGYCDPTKNVKQVTFKLKGRRSDPSCAPTTSFTTHCADFSVSKRKGKKKSKCKYNKKARSVSDCDPKTNRMTIIIPLKENQDESCAPTLTKEKSCRKKSKTQGAKRRNGGCVYEKQAWSECNTQTNTRQREMILKQGDETQCLPKKIVTKKCRKECRYIKGEWSPCNASGTNEKSRTLTPKPGSAATCEAKSQVWRCSTLSELSSPKTNRCKYNMSEWTPCDPRTNTRAQTMSLKSGDPNICMRAKKLTRKCKIACKFRRGQWSECDEKTELTTRVDTLIKGRDCEQNREITKKCKRACKYSYGDWGECDAATNTRTRVKTLLKGDAEKCKGEELVAKPCTKRDGGERCFFGPWGDFGPCQNGVTKKERPLLQGGVACERKAVVTKACST